jgi:2-dehydropantoate 2-reductase
MKVCIVGAGAIGGFIGARLALKGQAQVSTLARGATLESLRKSGWRLREAAQAEVYSVPCVASASAHELGIQDLVIIAVKAPALPALAPALMPLLGKKTLVMAAMNGVPWWFLAHGAKIGDPVIESVDPGGAVSRALGTESVLGCVVHASTKTPEPGLVQVQMGNGLVVGDPAAQRLELSRAAPIAELLSAAGFAVTHSNNIRYDIWYKLWGNMTMNPISAITGATADKVLDDPQVRQLCSDCMREASQVGALLGCPIEQSPEDRHQITRKLGAFKTSMLQDVEAGRPIELEALVGVVRELAGRVGVKTPSIDALYGLSRLFGQERGLLA